MKKLLITYLLYILSGCSLPVSYHGTIFPFKDVIKPNDPSTFKEIKFLKVGLRNMFDRRNGGVWSKNKAFLFNAIYTDGLSIEIQVNPEFKNSVLAFEQAKKYAKVIGQLPHVLRKNVETVWLHKGDNLFGGGNLNLLIHTGKAEGEYIPQGILEEVLIHEATHTSLDCMGCSALGFDHRNTKGWQNAVKTDNKFISRYAKDFPYREDMAETFLVWMVVRYRSKEYDSHAKRILATIPNRIKYFDEQNFNMFPIEIR